VITEAPVDVELEPYVDVTFPCEAKSDPSTPLTRRWYFQDKLVANDDVMYVASNGSLVVRLSRVDQGGTHLTGIYLCHVTNGYSTDEAYARLYLFGAERTYQSYTLSFLFMQHTGMTFCPQIHSISYSRYSDTSHLPFAIGYELKKPHLH